jgi:hypothetical protein
VKFFVVSDVGGCRESSDGWMGTRGKSDDAFGCWEEDEKGVGCIGWVLGVGQAMRVIAPAEGCRHGLMSKNQHQHTVRLLRAQAIRGCPLLKFELHFSTTHCNSFK